MQNALFKFKQNDLWFSDSFNIVAQKSNSSEERVIILCHYTKQPLSYPLIINLFSTTYPVQGCAVLAVFRGEAGHTL